MARYWDYENPENNKPDSSVEIPSRGRVMQGRSHHEGEEQMEVLRMSPQQKLELMQGLLIASVLVFAITVVGGIVLMDRIFGPESCPSCNMCSDCMGNQQMTAAPEVVSQVPEVVSIEPPETVKHP